MSNSDWSVSDVEEVLPILNEEEHEEVEAIKQHEKQLELMDEKDFIDVSDDDSEPITLQSTKKEWEDELQLFLKKDSLNNVEVYYCQCLCVLIKLIEADIQVEYHPIVDLMIKIKKYMLKMNSSHTFNEDDNLHSEELKEMVNANDMDSDTISNDQVSKEAELEDIEELDQQEENVNIDFDFDELMRSEDEESEIEEKTNSRFKRMINNAKKAPVEHTPVDLEEILKSNKEQLNEHVNDSIMSTLNQNADQFSSSDEEETIEDKISKLTPAAPQQMLLERQRKVNYSIMKNKQFTSGKKSYNSNPRLRKKKKFIKASKKIKSMHSVYEGKQNYQGELSGINDRVIKSVSFQ